MEAFWLEFSDHILHAVYSIQLFQNFRIKLQYKEKLIYNTHDP